jgi:hypothetical protein
MKIFKHMGKIGDVIFSLPTIKYFGGGILYLPERTHECPALYSNMKSLLMQQPYIHEVCEYPSNLGYMEIDPSIPIQYDLDRHRLHPAKGAVNMVKRYFEIFGITGVDHRQPWLTVEGPREIEHDYNLISLTPRFRDNSRVDWKRIYDKIPKPVYFIGTVDEHEEFVEKISPISRLYTTDLLTFAIYIRDCTALYCNQSAALVLSQSIHKTYHCDFKPRKNNCKFYTINEHELI